jgi:hypothetical protein
MMYDELPTAAQDMEPTEEEEGEDIEAGTERGTAEGPDEVGEIEEGVIGRETGAGSAISQRAAKGEVTIGLRVWKSKR